MMDVLLVNSIDFLRFKNGSEPSIGLLILKNILKEKYDVEVLDFRQLDEFKNLLLMSNHNISIDDVLRTLANYIVQKKAKVIGFYTICHSFVFTVQVAEYVRELSPQTKIVFGGPHATLTAEDCLSSLDFADAVLKGEAELSIMDFMDALMDDGEMSSVSGAVYRQNNEIVTNPCGRLLNNEELSLHTIFDYSPYKSPEGNKIAIIEGGRGCPYKCSFCSTSLFWGTKFRIKPVDTIINEMKKLNELHGFDSFSIGHDHFTSNKRYIIDFCNKLIEDGSNFNWFCSSRVDALDDELIVLLAKSNCKAMYIGLETGSERMQELINKKLDLSKAFDNIKRLHEVGIKLTVSFIYGYPNETEEDFIETLKMIESLLLIGVNLVQLGKYMVLPCTEDTEKIKNKLYFDINDINFTIFSKYLCSEKSIAEIKKHPDIYMQYYTFDSPVTFKYRYFESFMFLLQALLPFYKKTLEWLIVKHGLNVLYKKYEHVLAKTDEAFDKLSATNWEDENVLSLSNEIMCEIFLTEEREINDHAFSQLCKFERILVEHRISKPFAPTVHEFDFNMEKLRKTGERVKEKYYARYTFTSIGDVVVQKCNKGERFNVIVPVN